MSSQGVTHTLLPAPRPAGSSARGTLTPSAGDPHPAGSSARGTLTPSTGNPHPARACGAPPPPPLGGGVRAWRYQVSSRARGGAGGKPYPALFRLIPVHWTVGISPLGEGLTGRGNLFPLPCLQLPRYRNPRCPTPPAPSALRPRPAPGQGQCLRYQGISRARGGAGGKPYLGWSRWKVVPGDRRCAPAFLARSGPRSSPAYPHGVDRGVSRHGGGRPCPASIRTDACPSPPSPACFRIFQVR